MNKEEILEDFMEDYNALLEELNDAMGGIDDIGQNKRCMDFKKVKIADLEQDELLYNTYFEILESKN